MPITHDEVQDAIEPLFLRRTDLDVAFKNEAFLDEVVRAESFINGGGTLDWEYFNRLLIAANLGPVDRPLFERYFPRGINSEEKLREGVTAFMKDALLHFGSFHQAFLRLKADVGVLTRVEQTFGSESRAPFSLAHPLKVEQLAYLGYVSGELPTRMEDAHKAILAALGAIPVGEVTVEAIKAAAKENGVDIEKALATLNEGLRKRSVKQLTLDEFGGAQVEIRKSIDDFVGEVRRCRKAGIKNQEQYINSVAEMDVYVATSMRDERDYSK